MVGVLVSGHFIPLVSASGLTNDVSQPGQVRTTNQDGVLTLTAEVNPGGATPAAFTDRLIFSNLNILPPEGFAKTIGGWITAVMTFVMIISSLLVLGYLIWGALNWITSGGDKGKVDQARQKMIAAVVGLIIVSASYAVLVLVLAFLGFDSVEDLFSSIQPLDGSAPPRVTNLHTTPSPSPSASPIYSEDLGELLE